MKRVLFMTSSDACPGFRLAGIQQLIAERHDFEDILVKAIHDPENALIVIDERLSAGMDDARMREIEQAWPGVIVILPSPAPSGAEDYALKLIARVIGYHVRLRL